MKAHIVENNTIVNTIEVESLDVMENLVEAIEGSIGWSYIDGVASPPIPDFLEEKIRTERNFLLTDSDWTQVADAPVDQAAWATYRQALRDIPSQDGFPSQVIWPNKP
jgi:hypothetical protein